MKRLSPLLLLVFIGFISCNQKSRTDHQAGKSVGDPETLVKVNQTLVTEDAARIRQTANERNWQLTESGSGLFYHLYRDSSGYESQTKTPYIQALDQVTLNYEVRLLDSTRLYSSAKDGKLSFEVDGDPTITGLHEAVKLMHQGDSAKLILLPHLGYGLIGDGQRIPARAILWYEIGVDTVITKAP